MPRTGPAARLLGVLFAGLALAACDRGDAPAGAGDQAVDLPPPPPPDPATRAADALATFLEEREIREVPAHRDAFVDLDGDGRDDLLMLLEDPNWCGSGGCTLLVFRQAEAGFELVTETSVTHPPIAVSTQRHAGWHDLLVNVGGGGLEPGTVVLQHDGTGYPDNPSLMAALATDALPTARVVIE
ncbi:hypothetical protein GCM10028862_09990 [Luteimonas pelagia]